MSIPVHILITCNKSKLLSAATLVFKTLRVGFPTAPITAWLNGEPCNKDQIVDAAMKSGCELGLSPATIHHDWIKERLKESTEPFWICDTDIIFHRSVEDWSVQSPLMGAYTPRFHDRFTKCETAPRLHTSLLRFDPVLIGQQLQRLHNSIRVSRFSPLADLISPVVVPPNTFFDTCALLYQTVGGTKFTDVQLEAYEHLHGATWVDELSEAYPGLQKVHESIYADNSKAIGSHRMMQQFYASPGNTLEEFCAEVCLGNKEAMEFCTLWFHYCHLIDDLVDSIERPEHEKLLEAFALANALYTTKFYQQNQYQLHPMVMMITNAYADSVKWEKSSSKRRSTIADVLRCVGNEMFFTVAYVCGGWQHQRSVSSRIRERSWELQHDSNDQPD